MAKKTEKSTEQLLGGNKTGGKNNKGNLSTPSIFKLFFVEGNVQHHVREETKSAFLLAYSIRDIRNALQHEPIQIIHITPLEEPFLTYEKENNPDFKVLEII